MREIGFRVPNVRGLGQAWQAREACQVCRVVSLHYFPPFLHLSDSSVDTRKAVHKSLRGSVKIIPAMKDQFTFTRAALGICKRPEDETRAPWRAVQVVEGAPFRNHE